MNFTPVQQRALSIAPHVTAPLSLIGSCFIIKSVLKARKVHRAGIYHRLLLGMSIMEMLATFWFGLSTFPIPKGTSGVWEPAGTTATCTAQGFFLQLSTSVPLYNASLSVYYLLVNRYKWDEKQVRSAEVVMHAVSISFPVITALVSIPLKLFNNASVWCWIAPFPQDCKSSYQWGEEGNCIRGDNAMIYIWAFVYGPIWTCIGVSMVSMILVYWTVLQHERAVDKLQEDGVARRTQSKRVAWQSFWYILAFYVAWVPGTIGRVLQTIPATKGKSFFPVCLFMSIFLPMQGFFNFIVYARARFHKYRRENPMSSTMEALGVAAFSKCPPVMSLDAANNCAGAGSMPSQTLTVAPIPTEQILNSDGYDSPTSRNSI